MKKNVLGIICLSLCISTSLFADDKKTIKSKLDAVTVFFQGAELNHSASGTLSRGENEIYIEGLSPNIDVNSLKIKASNSVIISSYEFSVDYLSESKVVSPASKRLLDSIDFYQKKVEQLNTDITVTNNLISFLQKGTDKNVAGSENGLGIDELVKTMDYYKTKSTELQLTQADNNKKKKTYDEALSRLRNQLSQETTKNNKTSGVLKLTLAAPVATASNFTISYYTSAANWVPYYDITVVSTDKPITIAAKSKVRQTTGLDWEKVKLTLSTATPSNGKTAPLFSAWFLKEYTYGQVGINQLSGRVAGLAVQNSYSYDMMPAQELQEVVTTAYGTRKDKQAELLYIVDGNPVDAGYVAALDPSMIKSRQRLTGSDATAIYGSSVTGGVEVITLKNSMDDYITMSDNDMNVTYNIDIPYTIQGNGKVQSIDLQTKQVQAEYKYYSAPKLDTETYLLAEIADWEKLNLLSGKANITYDGTYVGESMIDTRSTTQKLALTLGSDKRVTVKRERLKDFSSTKFLDSGTKQVFTYRITVKNNQTKPVKMVLKDQYPISTQKNIEVELITKDTTPWTANKEDIGVVSWEEELPAGATKTYEISYSVKYPKGMNLNL